MFWTTLGFPYVGKVPYLPGNRKQIQSSISLIELLNASVARDQGMPTMSSESTAVLSSSKVPNIA